MTPAELEAADRHEFRVQTEWGSASTGGSVDPFIRNRERGWDVVSVTIVPHGGSIPFLIIGVLRRALSKAASDE